MKKKKKKKTILKHYKRRHISYISHIPLYVSFVHHLTLKKRYIFVHEHNRAAVKRHDFFKKVMAHIWVPLFMLKANVSAP